VLRSNTEVSGVFGVTEYPTLLVVCGGNKDVVIKFEGACCLSGTEVAAKVDADRLAGCLG
jgi:hypothetical protein